MERYHFMLLSEGAAASDIRLDHNMSGAHGPSHYLPAISGTDNGQQEFINYPTIDFGEVPELTLYDALAHTAVQDAPPFLPPPDFSDNLQSLFDDISTLRATMSSIDPGMLDGAPSTVDNAQSQITHIPSGGQYAFATGYNYTESDQLANTGTTYAHQAPSALAVDSVNQALLLSQNHHVQGYTPSVHPSVPIYDPEPARPYCANEISSAYETQSHCLRPHAPELDAFATHDVYNDTMVGSFHRSLSTSIGFEGPFWGAQSQGYQPLNQPSFLGAYPGGLPSRDPTTTGGASYTENFVDPRLLGGPEGIVNGYQPATGYIPDDHYEFPRDYPIERPLQFELTGRTTFTCDPIDPAPSFRSSVGEPLDQRQSREVSPAILEAQDSQYYHGRSNEQCCPNSSNMETLPVLGSHYTTYGLSTPDSATFPDSPVDHNSPNEQIPFPPVHAPFASPRLTKEVALVQTSRDSPAMANTGMITPPSSAGIQYPSSDKGHANLENVPVLKAAPRDRRADRQKKTQRKRSLQIDTTFAEVNSATSQGWPSTEAQPTPLKRFMTMTPEDFLRCHTVHEGLSKDRTELTKKPLPKAPKGKKKAPGKVKSPASQAASASTSKLPPKASKAPKSSDPVNCPVCCKSFGRRADCERHIQTGDATHLKYSQTEEFKNTCTRKKARPATSQCPHCNKAFPRQDSMRRHAMKKHKVDPNTLRLVMNKHKVDPDTTQRFEMVEMDVDEEEEYEYEDEDEEMDMD